MSITEIEQKLLDAELHEDSVERLLDHFQSMQIRLRQGEYEEAGTHIGNFCENLTNVLLDKMGEPIEERPNINHFVNKSTSGGYGTSEPREIRITMANMIRAAYDIRNNRDTVHVNLKVPVNHSDAQAGVRMCAWMLSELLRAYGDGDSSMSDIQPLIQELSNPTTSYIDEYQGDRLVQHTDLSVREEILLHLRDLSGKEVDVDDLVSWIPNKTSRSVKRSLSHMANDRLVWYDKDNATARITTLGIEKSESIETEYFTNSD